MIIPQTPSEKLMYSTVRLSIGNTCGTGFFYKLDTDKKTIIVVSNRHLAENVNSLEDLDFSKSSITQKTEFLIHLDDGNNQSFYEDITWFLHPTQDLAFFDLSSVLNKHPLPTNKNYYYIPVSSASIPSQNTLDNLFAIEDVVMLGYPNGLYDTVNNYPIFRTGKTGSHPAIDYNGEKKALLDVSCVPGSSGSPVFILDEGWIRYKNGALAQGNRVLFLGVENSMPIRRSNALFKKIKLPDGTNKLEKLEDYFVIDDMKLGYYIKASELKGFDPQIKALGL